MQIKNEGAQFSGFIEGNVTVNIFSLPPPGEKGQRKTSTCVLRLGDRRISVYGNSNCLDSSHMVTNCFWLLKKILDFTSGNIRDPVLFSDSVRQKEPLHEDGNQLPSRRTDANFSTYYVVLGKKLICRSDSRYEIWGTKGYILQLIDRNRRLPGFPSLDLGRGWNPTMENSRFGHDGSPKKNGKHSFTTSGTVIQWTFLVYTREMSLICKSMVYTNYCCVFWSAPLCNFMATSKEATMAEERFNWPIWFICTFIGETTRENLSPAICDWRHVDDDAKEDLRNIIAGTYELDPDEHQDFLDYKANMAFKNWKTQLRKNHYDIYYTDEERKNHRPKAVKKEDWNQFVDICSTAKEQEKREKGKRARSKIVIPHTTCRMGSAGKKEILARINRLIENEPEIVEKDLDHDPIALATRDSPPPDGVRGRNCIMKYMYGGTVPYGSIQLSGVAPGGFYRVIVDEVIHDDVQLFMEGGTFGNISSGETVLWYKSLTCFG
ncbi:hypothetical protein GIB67_028557 [Kingdonia uniflora]|uniref:MBTPS1 fourth domain-containing protein n=1 Tax=Kingdonia uniflora TaxID=39325 RepID=A0A7J7KW08_9MAGN|nr:hypothetical protein GIB67_028557 [Kingdonia uniflora]